MTTENRYDALRNRLLNDLFLAMAVIGTPAVILSIARSVTLGFRPIMLVQIALVSVIWSTWFVRGKLSYFVRAVEMMIILVLITYSSLTLLGPVADSKIFMVLFAFSAILFFPIKVAWGMIAAGIVGLALIGWAAVNRGLNFALDYDNYAYSAVTWMTTVWTIGFFSALMAYIGWRMVHGLKLQAKENSELASRLQRISERLPGMVFQYRLRPDGISSIPYASEAIRDIFRVSPELVHEDATAAFAAVHPDDLELVQRSILISSENLSQLQLEFRIAYPDGTMKWLFGNALPRREDDGSTLWHGYISDVTERKKSEQIKEEFISTVSHELRTPLTAVRGSIGLINSGAMENKPKEKEELLTIAEKNVERLLFLINDLLDIEKFEKGAIGLNRTNIDARKFVTECIQENEPFARQHRVEILLRECDEITFRADEQRIKQVMANLLSNAAKYSSPNSNVEIFVKRKGENIEFQVKDYGSGIPEYFRDKIFQKFTQADSSDRRKVGGTGLGLAIVKKIVDLHMGHVYYESQENAGTIFFVELPL